MTITPLLAFENPRKFALVAEGSVRTTAERCVQALERAHFAYVRQFPRAVDDFVELLERIGDPLPNYGEGEDLESYHLHQFVNRVRVTARSESVKRVHERAGALDLHSARAWREPRPRYFVMLMIDPGWQDDAQGRNGLSRLCAWHDALRLLLAEKAERTAASVALLRQTPIRFRANNVKETPSTRPLVYELSDARDVYDVGVRMKYDIHNALATCAELGADVDRYHEAVQQLRLAADRAGATYQMLAGDLIIIDNNRFAHGRTDMLAERVVAGRTVLNPRELWSATVD